MLFLRQMGLLCQSSIKMAENAFEQGEAKGYQEVFAPAKKWLVRCKPENRSLLIKNLSHFDTRSLLVTCNIMHLEEERTEHDIALIKKGIALKQHLLDWNHWLKLVASLKRKYSIGTTSCDYEGINTTCTENEMLYYSTQTRPGDSHEPSRAMCTKERLY